MIPVALGYVAGISLALAVVSYSAHRFGEPPPVAGVALLLIFGAIVGVAVGVEWGR